jgi:transposase-like protein
VNEGTTISEDAGRFRQDVMDRLRGRIREAIESTIEEELTEILGGDRYERNEDRRGYRNGAQERTVTTSMGPRTMRIPRARITEADGTTREFRSEILPRYARRTREIDDAILGVYLAGANSRRIRKALEPMLGSANVSKSAVSRIVGRLKAVFEAWSGRDLTTERYEVLYLDGFHLKVRLAAVSCPFPFSPSWE